MCERDREWLRSFVAPGPSASLTAGSPAPRDTLFKACVLSKCFMSDRVNEWKFGTRGGARPLEVKSELLVRV